MRVRVPQLTQCCCGCTLETGSLVIGWMILISSLIAFILCIVGVVMMSIALNNQNELHGHYAMVIPYQMYVTLFVYSLTMVVLSSILLVGVNKKNDKYLHTWVIINFYNTFVTIALMVSNIFIFMVTVNALMGFVSLLILSISMILELYFICVVHNLRRKFTNEKLNKASFPLAQNLI